LLNNNGVAKVVTCLPILSILSRLPTLPVVPVVCILLILLRPDLRRNNVTTGTCALTARAGTHHPLIITF